VNDIEPNEMPEIGYPLDFEGTFDLSDARLLVLTDNGPKVLAEDGTPKPFSGGGREGE
jgi:hypothetical protein